MTNLSAKKVAILATDGFEQSELVSPKEALTDSGATVHVLSLQKGSIKGWDEDDWGDSVEVDFIFDDIDITDYDALILPGGLINPDTLRHDGTASELIKSFHANDSSKPIAAICHGPWLLIEAQLVKGKTLTSFPSIQTDMKNAGANWVNRQVAIDGNIITSRNPDDLQAFNQAIIDKLASR